MTNSFLFAFTLTSITGLATCLGSLLLLFLKQKNFNFLSFILAFSAGIMIYVSLFALLPESINILKQATPTLTTYLTSLFSLILGIIIGYMIEKYINHKNAEKNFSIASESAEKTTLLKTSALVAITLAVHNFPEGLATFISAISNSQTTYPVMLSMALHNIPEGIAVAMPVFYITGSKKKAFIYSLLSGLIEPVGAVFGYVFLNTLINHGNVGIIFSLIAGIMIFVSLETLYSLIKKHKQIHQMIGGLLSAILITLITFLTF